MTDFKRVAPEEENEGRRGGSPGGESHWFKEGEEEWVIQSKAMNEVDAGRDGRRTVSLARRALCSLDHRAICLTNALTAGFRAFDTHLLQIHMTTQTASGRREGLINKIRN